MYFVVEFHCQGENISQQTIENGNSAIEPIPKIIEGYTFVEWDKAFDNITGNLEVNAIYEKKIYTVTFIYGENSYICNVEYGSSAAAPQDTEIEGYTFLGWNKPFNCIKENTTITAIYQEKVYFVVEFHCQGENISQQTIENGNSAIEPIPKIIEGYTFVEWDKVFDNITGNLEVNAIYAKNIYTVTFIYGDNSYICNVEYESSAAAPQDTEIEGYTFIKWEEDFNNIKTNKIINAIYHQNVYTVSYYLYEKLMYKVEEIVHNSTLTYFYYIPEEEIEDGYEFVCWETDEQKEFDIDTPIKNDIKLYAKLMLKDVFIFYHTNGETNIIPCKYGDYIAKPENPDCNEGYYFSNWYSGEDFKTIQVFPLYLYEDKNIYAKFDKKEIEIEFSYYCENEMYSKKVIIFYGEIIENPNIEIEGYSITWYNEQEFQSLFNFFEILKKNTIIYGKVIPKEYIITFDTSPYEGLEINSKKFSYKSIIEFPEINLYGYNHIGFFCNGENFELQEMPSKNIELVPIFSPKKFTLIFDEENIIEGDYLSVVELPQYNIDIDKFYFIGWQDENGNIFNDNYTILGDMNFVSKYTEIRKISINYMGSSKEFNLGDDVSLEDPQKEDYIFLGWYTDINLSIEFNNKAICQGDEITLYAKWEKSFYTLQCNFSGITKNIIINYGETTPILEEETMEGFNFGGWFFDEDYKLPYQQIFLTKDTNIFPKFEKKIFQVTFVGLNNRIILSQNVFYNDDAICPDREILMEEGYEFLNFDKTFSQIKSDLTVRANYQQRIVEIYQDENGNVLESSIPPEKEGYKFSYWAKTTNNNTIIYLPVYALEQENGNDEGIFENGNDDNDTEENISNFEGNGNNDYISDMNRSDILFYCIVIIIVSFVFIYFACLLIGKKYNKIPLKNKIKG